VLGIKVAEVFKLSVNVMFYNHAIVAYNAIQSVLPSVQHAQMISFSIYFPDFPSATLAIKALSTYFTIVKDFVNPAWLYMRWFDM